MSELDYSLNNLLSFTEIINFLDKAYIVLEHPVIILNENAEIPTPVDDYLINKFSFYPGLKNVLISVCETYNTITEIEENEIYPADFDNYRILVKPINVYNNLSGFLCFIFKENHINIEKVNSFFNIFIELVKSKYEISDLVKFGLTHYKQISLLSLISEGTLYATDLADIYKKTLEIALSEANADIGLVFSLEQDGNILELVHKIPEDEDNSGYALFMDDNVIAKSVQNFTPIILNNLKQDKDFIHPLPFMSPRNYLIVPLLIKTRVVGVIALCDKKNNGDFSSIDSQIIRAIGAQAAITIENLRLFFQLKQNFILTIEALTAAIDKKDKHTRGHSKRVSEISLIIAMEMGIEDKKLLEDIKIGALLHDIGKIAIPTDILFKPTQPTETEWDVIRKHPEEGYDIVKSLKDFNGITPIIKYHHERWDGKGYPNGLKGEEIPIATRIVAVADAFDTIISKRPYKEAMTPKQAEEAIKKAAGTHFDTKVVNAFLQAFTKGKIMVEKDE